MQIERRRHGARERPLLLVAPHVGAHHEDSDRRARQRRRSPLLKPVVEPVADQRLAVDPGVRVRNRRRRSACSSTVGRACVHGPITRRWSDRAARWRACLRRPAKLRSVPFSSVSYQPVRWNAGTSNSVVFGFDVEGLPEFVVPRMARASRSSPARNAPDSSASIDLERDVPEPLVRERCRSAAVNPIAPSRSAVGVTAAAAHVHALTEIPRQSVREVKRAALEDHVVAAVV